MTGLDWVTLAVGLGLLCALADRHGRGDGLARKRNVDAVENARLARAVPPGDGHD